MVFLEFLSFPFGMQGPREVSLKRLDMHLGHDTQYHAKDQYFSITHIPCICCKQHDTMLLSKISQNAHMYDQQKFSCNFYTEEAFRRIVNAKYIWTADDVQPLPVKRRFVVEAP